MCAIADDSSKNKKTDIRLVEFNRRITLDIGFQLTIKLHFELEIK